MDPNISKYNKKSIVSLCLSLLAGLFLFILIIIFPTSDISTESPVLLVGFSGIVIAIVALVFGISSIIQAKARKEKGTPLAILGIIISIISIIIFGLFVAVAILIVFAAPALSGL